MDAAEIRWRQQVERGEIAYTGPSRIVLTSALATGATLSIAPNSWETIAGFAREVALERALLAVSDPDGEVESISPLSPVKARQILLEDVDVPTTRIGLDPGGA